MKCKECFCRNGHTHVCSLRPFNRKNCFHTRISKNNKCTACGEKVQQTPENAAVHWKKGKS